MAILIPSKNIYNIENQKVRENFIDNVQYKENAISTKEESNVEVYNKGFERTTLANQDKTKYFYIGTPINIPSYGYKFANAIKQGNYVGASYCEYIDCYRSMIEVKIEKALKDGHITNIDFSNTNNEVVNIEFSGVVHKSDCTVGLQWVSSGVNPLYRTIDYSPIEEQPILDLYESGGVEFVKQGGYNVETFSIPKELSASFSSSNTSSSANLNSPLFSLFYTITGKPDVLDEYFYRAIEFLSKCNTITASGEANNINEQDYFYIQGTYTQYIPLTATISINGTKIVLDVSSQEKTIGSGNSPFSLQENELMQDTVKMFPTFHSITCNSKTISNGLYTYIVRDSSYTSGVKDNLTYYYNGEKIKIEDSEYLGYKQFTTEKNIPLEGNTITLATYEEGLSKLGTNIINQYSNGKETATILCDINEYYNYDTSQPNNKGTLAISIKSATKPMFEIDDIVIPMVFGANGKDSPMAKYSNGEAKRFRVVGIRPYYDGAVWQELTLLEV